MKQSFEMHGNNIQSDNPRIIDIINEIKESNGKISEFMNNDNLIKVMSRMTNYIRYDIISKNEVITYKMYPEIEKDFESIFA